MVLVKTGTRRIRSLLRSHLACIHGRPLPRPYSRSTPASMGGDFLGHRPGDPFFCRRQRLLLMHHCQGLRSLISIPSKSLVLRVTIVILWVRAVAAINASRSERGSGTCISAQHKATFVSIGIIRCSNAGKTD